MDIYILCRSCISFVTKAHEIRSLNENTNLKCNNRENAPSWQDPSVPQLQPYEILCPAARVHCGSFLFFFSIGFIGHQNP